VYSYFESRGGEFPYTVFFGLQYFLKEYLEGKFFTLSDVEQAAQMVDAHMGPGTFNQDGWCRILEKHNGYLPLSIKAVPEGSVVPNRNVLMTIENTDPEFPWLTNYLETLLVQTWYPTTVATQSRVMKQDILRFLQETGDPSLINFKLHDFGFRGVSSRESAGIGGLAHLVSFLGTDTFEAIQFGSEFYHEPMAGFSIPAAEHSTITSWGKENEVDAFRNMLTSFPEGLVAVVSDSFNIFDACEHLWGELLHDEVMNRNGTVVIRPDSGDPTPTLIRLFRILGRKFPTTKNSKGYLVLDPHVRVIQGDGINRYSTPEILQGMKDGGWSADNIAFGSGGALLQMLNRDTLKFAFKCASIVIDDERHDVWKKPVTDPGKDSKRGKLKLILDNTTYMTIHENERPECADQLVEVFRDGKILKEWTLAEIREKAKIV
jgi:nicotinamide phosphoribosyltransferase